MEFLPTHLSQEIFFSLPCKDILSCKCVCRAWYKLISNPNFTSDYTKNSLFTSLFLIHRRDEANSAFLLEVAANGGVIKTNLKPKIPDFEHIHTRLIIIGSCNGLLFLWGMDELINRDNVMVEKVYCSNPLFDGCFMIALHESQYEPSDFLFVEYLIGYVSSTNNYKLLRIVFQGYGKVVQSADVFTVGIDSRWRRLDDDLIMYHQPSGVSLNGAYHWIFKHENLWCLYAFDFGKEKCGWISNLPDSLHDKHRIELAVTNNHILAIDVSDCSQITVWTMEEYGVAESWSRKIIVRGCRWYSPKVADLYVVAALPNGDILFSYYYKGDIVSLSSEKEHDEIKIYDVGTSSIVSTLYAGEFTPRFYSLTGDIRGTQC